MVSSLLFLILWKTNKRNCHSDPTTEGEESIIIIFQVFGFFVSPFLRMAELLKYSKNRISIDY